MAVPRSLDIHHSGSWLARRRQRRMRAFFEIMRPDTAQPILDVGGTEDLWLHAGYAGPVVCLNPMHRAGPTLPNVRYIEGNGCDMNFEAGSFDIVFSNSAIEHVGAWGARQQFADEIRRVGRRWWVQTPNYWFPIEPHVLMPCYQFLPRNLRESAARYWPLGWHDRRNPASVEEMADINLLTRSELLRLFPGGALYTEFAGPLAKSFSIYKPV